MRLTHTLILFLSATVNANMDKEENDFLDRGVAENAMRNSTAARKRQSEVFGYCGSSPNIASPHIVTN